MKKRIILVSMLVIACLSAYNQYFTIEDIELGRLSYLRPDDLDNLQWNNLKGNIIFSQGDTLFESDTLCAGKNILLELKQLNQVLLRNMKDTLKSFPTIKILSENRFFFIGKDEYYIFDLDKRGLNKLFSLPTGVENTFLSPDDKFVAYTFKNNVWLQDESGKRIQVTFDSIEGISNGNIPFRNEFGIEEGLFWSPKTSFLAFYRKDETGVGKYPVVNFNSKSAETEFVRYPMAGTKSEETDVLIYSLENNSLTRLDIIGDKEQYNTNISWTPDEKFLSVQHVNRGQDTMILKSYDTKTGKLIEEIFKETDNRYVEPQHPVVYSKLIPGDFFWQSNKDGFNHLYYYNAKNSGAQQLTSGPWEVTEFSGLSPDERFLYFMATKEHPQEMHCYRLDRISLEISKITSEAGTHEVTFNKDMTYFIDRFSSYSVANKINFCSNNGEVVRELLVSDNPVNEYTLGDVERGTIKAVDDSTNLYYSMVKPVDFDPNRKYPVIVYVYGGSHVQLLSNTWMDRIEYFQQYMAQNGFVSFTLDSRGSANRGKDFEDVVYRQLGIPQLEDQMSGINYLKTLPYLDTNRIGVHGWSFGGYMTIFMMLKHPEIFKTGVAGGPVIDWEYYEVMYTERYMDTPSENPEGYEIADLKNYAGELAGDLLIIHGAIDPTVVWQQSLIFLQACIEANTVVDYFIYPTHEHNVAGKDRVHLTGMLTRYFLKNL